MITGAIALYEEALREQAPALALRTADGRGLPLQISRCCGPPDRRTKLLRPAAVPSLTWAAVPGG